MKFVLLDRVVDKSVHMYSIVQFVKKNKITIRISMERTRLIK
jgi:hypothetical protein